MGLSSDKLYHGLKVSAMALMCGMKVFFFVRGLRDVESQMVLIFSVLFLFSSIYFHSFPFPPNSPTEPNSIIKIFNITGKL